MDIMQKDSIQGPGNWAASTPLLRFLNACQKDFIADDSGEVASYIPQLGMANPGHFGISLATLDGHVYESGDSRVPFTIQSISKPFVFALALDRLGAARVESTIGVEPSGDPFNSIRLNSENHPFNPMVNAGAIACSGLILEAKGDTAFEAIRDALSRFAGRELDVDEAVYASETSSGDRNRAIGYLLRNSGVIRQDVSKVLDVYFRQCSVLVTARDAAIMAATLANRGTNPVTGEQSHNTLRHIADAIGDDLFRHVRLRRRVDLPGRHSREKWCRGRHLGGAAGPIGTGQLFAAARFPR
jgi:glutaminase